MQKFPAQAMTRAEMRFSKAVVTFTLLVFA
jgi:hypothetical protein